jgi:hypothetical protein
VVAALETVLHPTRPNLKRPSVALAHYHVKGSMREKLQVVVFRIQPRPSLQMGGSAPRGGQLSVERRVEWAAALCYNARDML